MTAITPDSRIAVSRVISGRPSVVAAAQINASNGSRVNRSSSARNTWAVVVSSGWYAGLLKRSSKNARTGRWRLIRAARAVVEQIRKQVQGEKPVVLKEGPEDIKQFGTNE